MFRATVIAVIGAFFGYATIATAQIAFLDPSTATSAWYEHPALGAGAVTGLFLLASKYLERWWDARKDNSAHHLSLSEKMEELTAQQWVDVIKKRDELHLQEISFLRQQNITLEINKFEYREKHLAAMDEVSRLQAAVLVAYKALDLAGAAYDAVPVRSYYEILDNSDISKKVADYTAQLNERHAAVMAKA